jgi:hypothetical protein
MPEISGEAPTSNDVSHLANGMPNPLLRRSIVSAGKKRLIALQAAAFEMVGQPSTAFDKVVVEEYGARFERDRTACPSSFVDHTVIRALRPGTRHSRHLIPPLGEADSREAMQA